MTTLLRRAPRAETRVRATVRAIALAVLLPVLVSGCVISRSQQPLATGDIVRVVDPKAGLNGRGFSIIEGRVHELSSDVLLVMDDTGAVFRMSSKDPFEIHRRDGRRGSEIVLKSAIIGAAAYTAGRIVFAYVQTSSMNVCTPLNGCTGDPVRPPLSYYPQFALQGALAGAAVGAALTNTAHWYRVPWPATRAVLPVTPP